MLTKPLASPSRRWTFGGVTGTRRTTNLLALAIENKVKKAMTGAGKRDLASLPHLSPMWLVADTPNAPMAVPNLIALVLLSSVVRKVTRDFFATGKD
jgi:hypothetical protein